MFLLEIYLSYINQLLRVMFTIKFVGANAQSKTDDAWQVNQNLRMTPGKVIQIDKYLC